MEVNELTIAELRAIIADMRLTAHDDRTDAGNMMSPAIATILKTNATVLEHWANRLEALL